MKPEAKNDNEEKISIEAGLLRRASAFAIDIIALSGIGFLLSIPFSDFFYSVGFNGWWIGFLISFVYFVLLQASGKSQTLGAKLLGISIINANGDFIGLQHAFIRNILFLVAVYNTNILALLPITTNVILQTIVSSIVISYIVGIFVFILFHSQHRGLHDLLSKSYVINLKKYNKLSSLDKKRFLKTKVSINKPKKITLVLSIVVTILLIVVAIINPVKSSFLNELVQLRENINKNESVMNSDTVISIFTPYSSETSTTSLIITVYVNKETFYNDAKAQQLRAIILKQSKKYYLSNHKVDDVQVRFITGYSIGIATFSLKWNTPPVSSESIK